MLTMDDVQEQHDPFLTLQREEDRIHLGIGPHLHLNLVAGLERREFGDNGATLLELFDDIVGHSAWLTGEADDPVHTAG